MREEVVGPGGSTSGAQAEPSLSDKSDSGSSEDLFSNPSVVANPSNQQDKLNLDPEGGMSPQEFAREAPVPEKAVEMQPRPQQPVLANDRNVEMALANNLFGAPPVDMNIEEGRDNHFLMLGKKKSSVSPYPPSFFSCLLLSATIEQKVGQKMEC